jgi:hypothetical protein
MKWYKTYVAKAPGERFRAICYAWNFRAICYAWNMDT